MSRFEVIPPAAAEASGRLATIPGGVHEAHSRLHGHASAGAGTPAAGAVDELMGRWAAALPRFAASAASLSQAVAAAGRAYSGTDTAIAEAAGGGGGA